MASPFRIFADRRMAVLLGLGFASGLPAALTDDSLKAWITDARPGSLAAIGLFTLVGWPYTVKFLWAPLFDRYRPPFLGRRRGWLVLCQLLLIAAIAALPAVGLSGSLWALAGMAVVVAFLSASQDIVVDAYRSDVLDASHRGPGAAVCISGYRIATIVGTAGAMQLVGWLSWPTVYLLMAGAMAVGLIATLAAPEPPAVNVEPGTLGQSVVQPLKDLVLRRTGLLVLLFVVLFKLPDAMAGAMTIPFLRDIGFTNETIGQVRQFVGMWIMIAGALIGGGIVARLGLWRSLWVFGILQAISNAGFAVLAQIGADTRALVAVVGVENFCTGLTAAGFVAFLMSQCSPRFSATQYALLASLMALTRIVGGAPSGFLADHLGWTSFFLLSVAAGVPGMVLLLFLRPREQAGEDAAEPQTEEVPVAKAA